MRYKSPGPIGITTGGLWNSNPSSITIGGLGSNYIPPFTPNSAYLSYKVYGTPVPLRRLTQRQAGMILPQWIRWYLAGKLEIRAEGDGMVLHQEVLTLKLNSQDYTQFQILVTQEPWIAGYNLPEPLLTQWIAAAIQSVFTFAP